MRLSATAWGAIALTCVSAALAGLGASAPIWIAVLGFGLLAGGMAVKEWIRSPDRTGHRTNDSDLTSSPSEIRRYGYIGRGGSSGDLSHASFSDKLDVGIDSEGEVDASHAEFGVPTESDETQEEEPDA
jgi:hypothetical protein